MILFPAESTAPPSLQIDDDIPDPEENEVQGDPFEGILIWPKVNDKTSDQKSRRKDHVPSVATSDRWRQWYNKKDEERKQKEEAKMAKAEERKLIRIMKEKEQETRKQQREEKKLQKKKIQQEKENNPNPRKKKKIL